MVTKVSKPPKPSVIKLAKHPMRDHLYLHQLLMEQYGGIVEIPFQKNHYSITDPAYLHHVLTTNEKNYDKQEFVYELATKVMGDSILTTSDKMYWRHTRKQLQPFFQPEQSLRYRRLIAENIEHCILRLNSCEKVDIGEEMQRLVVASIQKLMLSDQLAEFEPLIITYCECANRFGRSGHYKTPWLPTIKSLRFKKYYRLLQNALTNLIESRRRNPGKDTDLLTLLMAFDDPNTGKPLTNTQLIGQIITLLITGYESTANALVWVWYRITYNQTVENKLHAEADAAFDTHALADLTLADIPYCDRIFKEIIRLYPSVWLFGRRAINNDMIGDYRINANDKVVICPYAIHRNPKYWPNPEKFDPDRFLPDMVKARPKYSYLPFGLGPRTCLGVSLASLQGPMIIAALAKHFKFRFTDNCFMEPEALMFMRAKHRGKAKVIRR